jgi:hypothetical protein
LKEINRSIIVRDAALGTFMTALTVDVERTV